MGIREPRTYERTSGLPIGLMRVYGGSSERRSDPSTCRQVGIGQDGRGCVFGGGEQAGYRSGSDECGGFLLGRVLRSENVVKGPDEVGKGVRDIEALFRHWRTT